MVLTKISAIKMAFKTDRCITAEEAAAAAEFGVPDVHPILIDGLSEDLQRRFGELLRNIDALKRFRDEEDEEDTIRCLLDLVQPSRTGSGCKTCFNKGCHQ